MTETTATTSSKRVEQLKLSKLGDQSSMNTKTPCFFFFNNNNIYICLANEGGAGGARKQNRNEWQVWHRGDFRESRLSLYPSAFFFPFFVNEQQFILARLRRLSFPLQFTGNHRRNHPQFSTFISPLSSFSPFSFKTLFLRS